MSSRNKTILKTVSAALIVVALLFAAHYYLQGVDWVEGVKKMHGM